MQKESALQSKILNDLRSLGKYCTVFKIIKSSDDGVPDIFFTTAHTGGILVETKRTTGVTTKLQALMGIKLNMCGTKSFICYSWEEWMEAKQLLGLCHKTAKDAYDYRNRMLS
jgi:hypothetical protein